MIFKELWDTIKKGKIWKGILSNRAKDGSIYYVKTHIFPIFDNKGNIFEYLALREDITELIKAQKAYKRELKFSKMLLDNEDNIIIVSKNGKMQTTNDAFLRTFGYKSLEEFLSNYDCICDLFIEKEGYLKKEKPPKQWYHPILENPNKTHLALILDKYNQEKIFSVKARKVIYDDGTEFIVHTFNDITELEKAKRKAQEAEAMQAMFLANMSHEIRTPLNGILGFLELLQNTNLDNTQQKYLDIINSSSKTLLNIIHDILDFSKISHNKLELEKIELNPFIELETTFNLLKYMADKKSIQYINDFDANMAECIIADPVRLRQVISNLLSNAIKFTPEKGEIRFKTEVLKETQNSQTIRFIISDTGIGISEEKLKTIFKPFVQADSSTTRKFGGTGLGLAISYDLVKLFGGELKVKSKIDEGSTFYFDVEFEKCTNKIKLTNLLQNIKIIIIDDKKHHNIINQLKKALSSFNINYETLSIENLPDIQEIIIIAADIQTGLNLRKKYTREQIICINKECNCEDKNIDCINIPFDEAFVSHLYNFLSTKLQNKNFTQQKTKKIFKPIKILIAEDYEINRLLIEEIIKKYPNIEYEFAFDGLEATKKALENHYDLILMDINMPNLNGLEATKIIKDSKQIPIIALTANALKGDKERFLNEGFDDYLSKPIDITKLENILNIHTNYQTNSNKQTNSQESSSKQNELDLNELINTLNTKLGLDKNIIKTLLNRFVSSMENFKEEFEKAFNEKDNKEIANLAHKLKGAASTLTIQEIAKSMEELEKNIKENREINSDNIIKMIENYIELFKKQLQ